MEFLSSQWHAFVQYLPDLAGLIGAGLFAGFIAGLFGVGGGTVTVPILYYWFSHMGVGQDHAMHAAVGTSLATIIATSLASTRAHEKRGSVDRAIVKSWALFIAIGSISGALLAGLLSGLAMKTIFGGFLIFVAVYMFFAKEGQPLFSAPPTGWRKDLLSWCIAAISSIVGIGGGSLTVPALSMCNVPMQRAVGTSAALGLVIAIPGALGFIMSGWGQQGLPPFSIGYICLAALVILLPTTALTAPLGARLAHKLSRDFLKKIFAVFLGFVALKMLYGVYVH